MTRAYLIERLRRQVYGGFPTDDSSITDNLINEWISDGIGLAVKKNYADNLQLEGIAVVNNSFYSTFKGLAIAADEQQVYKIILPQLPIGIGSVDGISRVLFKDANNKISYPAVILNQSQIGRSGLMRDIPNKIICYPEGVYLYAKTSIQLYQYTAMVTMISGGDATDLSSTLNIPADYISTIVDYVKSQLLFERMQPVNSANDGQDAVKTA